MEGTFGVGAERQKADRALFQAMSDAKKGDNTTRRREALDPAEFMVEIDNIATAFVRFSCSLLASERACVSFAAIC